MLLACVLGLVATPIVAQNIYSAECPPGTRAGAACYLLVIDGSPIVTPPSGRPTVPTNYTLEIVATTDSTVTVVAKWAEVPEATRYQYRLDAGSINLTETRAIDLQESFTWTLPRISGEYEVRVRLWSKIGRTFSAEPADATVMVPALGTTPPPPQVARIVVHPDCTGDRMADLTAWEAADAADITDVDGDGITDLILATGAVVDTVICTR